MQERPSYIEWLKKKYGVKQIVEDVFSIEEGHKTSNNNFIFAENGVKAKAFAKEVGKTSHYNFEEWGFLVRVSLTQQQKLREEYLNLYPPEQSLEQIESQLKLIKDAKDKILAFNKLSAQEMDYRTNKTSLQEKFKAFDKVGMMAKLLRNKDNDSWYSDIAIDAAAMALSIYHATNFTSLSSNDHKQLLKAQQLMIGQPTNEKQIGSLKTDTSFLYSNSTILRKEYVQDLLDGGYRKLSNSHEPSIQLITMHAKEGQKNSYYQPRFFPNKQGPAETDTIVIEAGGMEGHSAMRILKREGDKYFYIKADGGAGVEQETYNGTTKYYGIYTTEIKPIYKRTFWGGYTKLTSAEQDAITQDKTLYDRYMKDTIQHLLETEKEISNYKKPNIEVNHGENKGINMFEARKWEKLNKIIETARGQMVVDRCHQTTIQLSANCTVYSLMLTIGAIAGSDIGYDMMQQAKRYNHHDVLWKLNTLEQELLQKQSALRNASKTSLSDKQTFDNIIDNMKFQPTIFEHTSTKISGLHPLVWAALNNETITGKDPIIYAIEQGIKIDNMHPLIFSVVFNKNIGQQQNIMIEGKTPIAWALSHPEKAINFVKYLKDYEVEKKSTLAKEGIDILSALVVEYELLQKQVPRNNVDIKNLERYYQEITNKMHVKKDQHDDKVVTAPLESQLEKMLNNYSAKEMARLLTAPLIIGNGEGKPHNLNLSVDHCMQHLSLKAVHKLVKVGHELEKRENSNVTVINIRDALSKFIDTIADLFKKDTIDHRISSALQSFAMQSLDTSLSKINTEDVKAKEKISMVQKVVDRINSTSNIIR